MTGGASSLDTLGRRLDDQARRIASRYLPDFPWARQMEVLVNHLASLPTPLAGRFERTELPRSGAELDFHGPRPDFRGPDQRDTAGPSTMDAALARDRPRASEGHGDFPAVAETTTGGRPLPSDVRGRLSEVVGRAAETLRVHDDPAADSVARAHRADAVTVGSDVFFREGKFRPHEPRGFGLLVHEATHVLGLLQPGAAWHRATSGGVHEEEEAALAREQTAGSGSAPAKGSAFPAIGSPAQPPLPPVASARPDPAVRSAAPASPALHPMTAAADREVGVPSSAPVDLEQLRRSLVPELMRQLRAEFERGG